MRSNTHTPGPWWWDGGRYIYGADWPDQGYVAEVNPHRSNSQREPDGEANARLIAASPDLRSVLISALLASGYGIQAPIPESERYNVPAWIYTARALLARVDGREEE